jgi:hypothetical protein
VFWSEGISDEAGTGEAMEVAARLSTDKRYRICIISGGSLFFTGFVIEAARMGVLLKVQYLLQREASSL